MDEAAAFAADLWEDEHRRARDQDAATGHAPDQPLAAPPDQKKGPEEAIATIKTTKDGVHVLTELRGTIPYIGPKTPEEFAEWRRDGRLPPRLGADGA